ncbi:MAG: alpha/beta fold hydrolase [Planctomycetes bacterium]|nr:alpha/beta fold hydrolase [Planctomycetota bacterium]
MSISQQPTATIGSRRSFRPIPPFRPHPLFRNPHAQTILSGYGRRPPPHRAARHETLLDDGDKIVLHDDAPASWRAGDPVVLLLHGLCGSHASPYVNRTAMKLNARGMRTFRMDLRGCGAGLSLASLPMHAGRSEDAAAAVAWIAERCPGSPIVVVGFSLGGNMVLKMAGEMGASAPVPLQAVIAAAPPIDLAATCRNLACGWNALYDRAFVRALTRHVRERRRLLPDAPHVEFSRPPRGVYEFDDLVTAPLSGFAGADDYYTRASSGPLLKDIRTPTLILAAADDPLVPAAIFDAWPRSPAVELHLTDHGGHLGYIGVSGVDPDRRWLEWRLVEQIEGVLKNRHPLLPLPCGTGQGESQSSIRRPGTLA